jgi:hypothetical protein
MLENTRWIDEISALLGIERGVIFRANANQVPSNTLKFSASDYIAHLGVHQSNLITYRCVPEGRLCQRALYGARIAHELGRRRKKGKGPGQLALQHRRSWILMPLGQGEGILDKLDNGVWRDVTEKVTDGEKWKIGRVGESTGFSGVPHPPAVHAGEPGLFVTAEDWASSPVVTSGEYYNTFTTVWLQNSMHGANFLVKILGSLSRLSPLDDSTTNLLRGWFLDMKYTFVKLDEGGCPGAGLLVSLIEQRWVDIPGEYAVALLQVYGNRAVGAAGGAAVGRTLSLTKDQISDWVTGASLGLNLPGVAAKVGELLGGLVSGWR